MNSKYQPSRNDDITDHLNLQVERVSGGLFWFGLIRGEIELVQFGIIQPVKVLSRFLQYIFIDGF